MSPFCYVALHIKFSSSTSSLIGMPFLATCVSCGFTCDSGQLSEGSLDIVIGPLRRTARLVRLGLPPEVSEKDSKEYPDNNHHLAITEVVLNKAGRLPRDNRASYRDVKSGKGTTERDSKYREDEPHKYRRCYDAALSSDVD